MQHPVIPLEPEPAHAGRGVERGVLTTASQLSRSCVHHVPRISSTHQTPDEGLVRQAGHFPLRLCPCDTHRSLLPSATLHRAAILCGTTARVVYAMASSSRTHQHATVAHRAGLCLPFVFLWVCAIILLAVADQLRSVQHVLFGNIGRVCPDASDRGQIGLGHVALHWYAHSAGSVGGCGGLVQFSHFHMTHNG